MSIGSHQETKQSTIPRPLHPIPRSCSLAIKRSCIYVFEVRLNHEGILAERCEGDGLIAHAADKHLILTRWFETRFSPFSSSTLPHKTDRSHHACQGIPRRSPDLTGPYADLYLPAQRTRLPRSKVSRRSCLHRYVFYFSLSLPKSDHSQRWVEGNGIRRTMRD